MQLQGIVFVQLQGNDILVNFQGNRTRYIRSSKSYSFKFRKNVHSRNLYSFNNVASLDIAEIFIQQVSRATLIYNNYKLYNFDYYLLNEV